MNYSLVSIEISHCEFHSCFGNCCLYTIMPIIATSHNIPYSFSSPPSQFQQQNHPRPTPRTHQYLPHYLQGSVLTLYSIKMFAVQRNVEVVGGVDVAVVQEAEQIVVLALLERLELCVLMRSHRASYR